MAELADAQDLKSCVPLGTYGFESRFGHLCMVPRAFCTLLSGFRPVTANDAHDAGNRRLSGPSPARLSEPTAIGVAEDSFSHPGNMDTRAWNNASGEETELLDDDLLDILAQAAV
jgi:hypothetical protein